MNFRLEKKTAIILSAAVLLAMLIYLGGYFLYLSPLKDSLESKNAELKSQQKLSSSLETRLASAESADYRSTAEIQKVVPVDPMTEQLILDLEKAEVVSDSSIISIEFDAGDESISGQVDAQEPEVTQAGQEQSASPETVTADTGQSANPDAPVTVEEVPLPEGLTKTNVTVKVEGEDYFELETFIKTLEHLKRIVMVSSISFKGPGEISSLNDEKEPIIMTLTLESFYMGDLEELKEYDTKVLGPEPANKLNPFPEFGSDPDDNTEEDETNDQAGQ